MFGRSFFEWVYKDERPDSAAPSALRLLKAFSGKQYGTLTGGPAWSRAMEEAESLPCYPQDGFICRTDEYILVKLSDGK